MHLPFLNLICYSILLKPPSSMFRVTKRKNDDALRMGIKGPNKNLFLL